MSLKLNFNLLVAMAMRRMRAKAFLIAFSCAMCWVKGFQSVPRVPRVSRFNQLFDSESGVFKAETNIKAASKRSLELKNLTSYYII